MAIENARQRQLMEDYLGRRINILNELENVINQPWIKTESINTARKLVEDIKREILNYDMENAQWQPLEKMI